MPLLTTNITIPNTAIQRINTCTKRIATAANIRERAYWIAKQTASIDVLLKDLAFSSDNFQPCLTVILHAPFSTDTQHELLQTLEHLRNDLEIIVISQQLLDAPDASDCHSFLTYLSTVFSQVRLVTWKAETSQIENGTRTNGTGLSIALRMARGLTVAVNPEPEILVRLIAALESHPEASVATASRILTEDTANSDLSRTAWRNWIHVRCGYPACTDCSQALDSLFALVGRETVILTDAAKDISQGSLPFIPPKSPATPRKVSIIIPVFNHAEYTRQCLTALKTNTSYPNYEVIVVDNGSSDETQPMLAARKDILVIRNTENKGFTEACNQGAQAATGDYLLFLNNDTIPLKGWLEPLVCRLDEAPWAGAAGSRLVYPNGTLQEAAAVVHSDGTASNFGRHDHPARPCYNRPCEVDYCSGASLLVRAKLFQEIGGFDMRYSPAYYEETDLCFALREMGKAVVYEPASTVVHFGSTTAGLDPTKGIRRHLVINREKFLAKWAHRLAAHEPPPAHDQRVMNNDRAKLGRRVGPAPQAVSSAPVTGTQVNESKQVTSAKRTATTAHSPRLCIISDLMPRFDASSSHLRVFQLMKLMRRLGWEIDYLYFLDTPRDAHYAASSGPGVRFRRTGSDAASMRLALDEIRPDCLWLTNIWTIDWATQAFKLTCSLKEHLTSLHKSVRIIVDTMDFHAKKHQRRYAAERTIDSLRMAEAFLSLERNLYPLADTVVTVTKEEARDIRTAVPNCAPITVIPNIHQTPTRVAPLAGRRHMVFLGNYTVQHNRDAAVWFATQILPMVRAVLPGTEFHLVGVEAHSQCADLATIDGVRLIGFVPSVEDTLAKFRIFVCPMTYGAGMKGKVGSAAANGLPVVTTSIGAEGFAFVSGQNCLIADTPQEFSKACLTLLRDDALWAKLSQAGPAVVATACSAETALSALEAILPKTDILSAKATLSDAATSPRATISDTGITPRQVDARLLAFYLPQFHRIPENDAWWGEGFTDWTNVRRTNPAFPGHDQPLIPGNLGWYDLADINIMRAQAELAQQHGIHGFCFYHYWFHGRRILETPIENYLASDISLPFCLCWANENWSRNWDGGNRELLLKQRHSPEDDTAHFHLLLRYMQDPRYIRVHEKPLLLIYRARLLPDPEVTASRWRAMAKRAGLPGLYLCKVEGMSAERDAPGDVGFDAAVEFQPDWANLGDPRPEAVFGEHRVYDYDAFVARQLAKPAVPYRRYPCVTPRWDNTPRRPKDSVILIGTSPERYRRWLSHAVESVAGLPDEERMVFINAWNEWGEGCALEPDLLHGNAYLEATAAALDTKIRALELQMECRLNELKRIQATTSLHHSEFIRYAQGFVSGSEKTGRWMGREARLEVAPPPGGGKLLLRVTAGHGKLYGGSLPAVTLTIGETKLPFPLREASATKQHDATSDGPSGKAVFAIDPGQQPFSIVLTADRQFVPVEMGLSQDRAGHSVRVSARFAEGNE